jgi:very-short-patch-repair endonuclease
MRNVRFGACCATGGWRAGASAGKSRSIVMPIDRYIVDFICFEARLIIEVDGGQHFESKTDEERDAYLRSQGFHVLRFWNTDVLANRDGAYRTILTALARCAPIGAAPSSSSA